MNEELSKQAIQERRSHHKEIEGVIKLEGQTPLAQEFIKAGDTFRDALARSPIRDINERNNHILYHSQMEMFNKRGLFQQAIEDHIDLITANSGIGGYNRSLAAMVGTNVYVPEGAGIKLSKESLKALESFNQLRGQRKEGDKKEGEDTA